MPIANSDIKVRYSIKTGSAGNTLSQGDVNESLGKYIATNDVTDATLHALFAAVTGDENAGSEARYRCIFVYNSHSTLTWQGAKCWISAEVADGADTAIGVDTNAAAAVGSGSAQAIEVADEETAPGGVSFTSPTTKSNGISIGDIAAGECRAIWVRRTATNSGAANNDGVTLTFEGDTGA